MDGHLFMCHLNRFNWGKKLHSDLKKKTNQHVKIFLVKKNQNHKENIY